MVPIPFKSNNVELGSSRRRAAAAFRGMESRFARKTDYRDKYVAFMDKLIERGITTEADNVDENQPHFYSPHHGTQPSNKKFRVMFNRSACSSNGELLNSLQLAGERLQDNLSEILLRFRLHRVTLAGDIEQMYPRVLLLPEFRNFQLKVKKNT